MGRLPFWLISDRNTPHFRDMDLNIVINNPDEAFVQKYKVSV